GPGAAARPGRRDRRAARRRGPRERRAAPGLLDRGRADRPAHGRQHDRHRGHPALRGRGPARPAMTTPAEQARTLVAQTNRAALATTSEDGSPWASLVVYAALADGTPVLCLSTLAEHGRNVTRDPRASLMVGEEATAG